MRVCAWSACLDDVKARALVFRARVDVACACAPSRKGDSTCVNVSGDFARALALCVL